MKDVMAATKEAQDRNKRITLRDDSVRGFYLLALPSGATCWRIEFRPRGVDPATGKRHSSRHLTFGNIATHTVAQARTAAAAVKAEVISGRDPVAEAGAKREKRDREATTLAQTLERYEEARLSELRSGKDAANAIRNVFGDLLNMPLQSITTPMIAKCLTACVQRGSPLMGNRALAYIRPLLRWAVEHGMIEANPAQGIRKPARETPRDRVMSLTEVRAVLDAADADEFPFRHVFRVLLFTACRRSEAADVSVDEIDLDESVWTLPADRTKTGRPLRIPLTRPACEAISGAMIDRPGLLFSTTGGRTPPSGFSKFKARLDQRSGINDWRFHDLRTAFATHCAGAGMSPEVVDRCLNHVGSSTMGVVARAYMQHDLYDQRKAALEYWAAAVLGTGR
jgi:integrase